MTYVVVALKSEAQAFVDRFKLPKTRQDNDIAIFVSGIGVQKMFEITKKIVKKMTKEDKILNVGICGANHDFQIGELIDGFKQKLTCVDTEISKDDGYSVVDMESSGFIEATKMIKNRYMFKIVSDYFQPHTITKEKTKQLVFNQIDEIMKRIET